MDTSIDLTEKEITLASKIAYQVARKWRNVSREDLEADLFLWLCNQYKDVVRYRTEEYGYQKLGKALYRWATKQAMRDESHRRGKKMGHEPDDDGTYDSELVRRILPFIWDWEDRPTMNETDDPMIEDARVMIADVAGQVLSLPKRDLLMLRLRYRDGLRVKEVATEIGLSESVTEKALGQAIKRLVARLNGPLPTL